MRKWCTVILSWYGVIVITALKSWNIIWASPDNTATPLIWPIFFFWAFVDSVLTWSHCSINRVKFLGHPIYWNRFLSRWEKLRRAAEMTETCKQNSFILPHKSSLNSQMHLLRQNPSGNWEISIFSGKKPCTRIIKKIYPFFHILQGLLDIISCMK